MLSSNSGDTLEVEVRGPISGEERQRLFDFLTKNGTCLGMFKRFLIDYSTMIEGVAGRKKDIRVRVTNGESEIIVKVGEWAGEHRVEASVKLKDCEFRNALHLMALLGYRKGVACERVIWKFLYKNVEFALQEVPGHSYFYEAEILATDEAAAGQAHAEIMQIVQSLRLSTFTKEEWYDYIETLNRTANSIFDFDFCDPDELFRKGVRSVSVLEEVKRELETNATHESLISAYERLKMVSSDSAAKKLFAEVCYLIARDYLKQGDEANAKEFAERSIEAYREIGIHTLEEAAPILFRYLPDIMHEDVVRDRVLSHVH